MLRWFLKLIYYWIGWKIRGHYTNQKCIIIVAPHTSNWDFVLGAVVRSIIRMNANFLGKKELFKFPLGNYLRYIGGHPVDRTTSHNMVDSIVDIYNKEDHFALAIAPEGTRKYVPKWKTGFYHIAKKAQVPIVMVGFDYELKIVEFREPFYPSDNMEKDMEEIMSYFRGFTGKHPELGVR